MTDYLTRFALSGAVVLFAVWLLLVSRNLLARAADRVAKMPRSAIAAFLFFVTVATVCAQKSGTNGVGQVEGGTNELLRTTEHAEAANASTENGWGRITDRLPQPPVRVAEGASEPSVVELFRLESETTNETYSYAMPVNATRYENWWRHGAYENVFQLDLDGMLFPLGEYLCDYLWVYTWGMVGARLADASNRVVASGVPMMAVPGVSRFWSAEEPDGGKILTWENFFLNRDTNTPVSAQLELKLSGDYIARSNLVERLYRRVNPDDWDDDGIPNDDDLDPYFYDGENFGPHQELPQGANSNAYCWVDLVVPNANSLVTFIGDGPSALPDPAFIAKAGETNRVTLLIGKTYQVTSKLPITCVGQSSSEIEVYQNQDSPTEMYICWPVVMESSSMRSGSSFSMSVWPDCLGGGFAWTNCCCQVASLGGWHYSISCGNNCLCSGCGAEGYYEYEAYRLPAIGGWCGCAGVYDPDPVQEDDEGPYAAGASATFSKSAVIFEDGYWNTPTNWVGRLSTQTELHCVAHGGPNGGHVRFEIAGESKLERVSGHILPVEQDVLPGKKLDFTIVYRGQLPSTNAEDIVVTTTFTENVQGATPLSSQTKLTSVKVELTAEDEAPANVCSNRHIYGVNEMVNVARIPASFQVSLDVCGDSSLIGADNDVFWCPWSEGSYNLTVAGGGAEHKSSVLVLAPIPTVVNAYWNGVVGTVGTAGNMSMIIELEVYPKTVSFLGIYMEEIPDESNNCARDGYFADPTNGPPWSHSFAAGAGRWFQIKSQGRWCADGVGTDRTIPSPWSSGWKVWSVPVGWGDSLLQLRGQVSPVPTTQRFEIDGNGVMSVRKYGHEIIRAPDNRVWVDGVQRN